MARKGTYYLGRIIKIGSLETKHIKSALRSPQSITAYGSAWTFVDVEEYSDGRTVYFFGRLAKYDPDAEVSVVDPAVSKEIKQSEPNLTKASSPFVYIPDYSGISFLHVSNKIEYRTFMARWSDVINRSHGEVLSSCSVDPIADIRSFAKKLASLDGIYSISATVSPPNPLFGPLWKHLKCYLEERRSDRMRVEEHSGEHQPLATELPKHVKGVAEQTTQGTYAPSEPLPIGDAAILMAADGYGTGQVRGKAGKDTIAVKTSETVKNFSFERNPDPEELYRKTAEVLQKIAEERHMEH